MAFLIVAGVTVSVSADDGAATEEPEFLGDRDRMFDGSWREVSDGHKRRWSVTTTPLDASSYATLRAALLGGAPLACSGDLLGGSVNCHVELGQVTALAGTELRRVLRFALGEA